MRRRRWRSRGSCLPTSLNLAPGQQRYSQLLNEEGGIIDDLMLTRPASATEDGALLLVVNASRKEVDYAHLMRALAGGR